MRTKYVLIERGEGFKNTYTTEKVALDAIARGTVKSYRPITLKDIKALRANEYRESDYFRHQAEEEFQTTYNDKTFKATVISWSGTEGLVKIHGADLRPQTIYACNISGKRTWYNEMACVFYTKGQVVDVQLKVFPGPHLIVCGLTPGHFDSEKWNSLDQSRLAFKCNENGEAINGLFGGK
jgi:hypothetical protein